MLRVYTASKLSMSKTLRDLCENNSDFFFHARWLKITRLGVEDSPKNAEWFWDVDVEDVVSSDVVLVIAVPGHHLRGALVEAGVAIAKKIPVITVGDHPDYGTWQYHRGVIRAVDLDFALRILRAMNESKKRGLPIVERGVTR